MLALLLRNIQTRRQKPVPRQACQPSLTMLDMIQGSNGPSSLLQLIGVWWQAPQNQSVRPREIPLKEGFLVHNPNG